MSEDGSPAAESEAEPAGDATTDEELDPAAEQERLAAIEAYLESMKETNPYYGWLEPEVHSLEQGLVRIRQPATDRTRPPEVGPAEGINGGVLMTLADAAGMAAIIAEALEPVPLATTSLDMSFHDGVDATHVVEAEVLDYGSTLATSRIRVLPEADLGEPDPRLLATGEATARLFD